MTNASKHNEPNIADKDKPLLYESQNTVKLRQRLEQNDAAIASLQARKHALSEARVAALAAQAESARNGCVGLADAIKKSDCAIAGQMHHETAIMGAETTRRYTWYELQQSVDDDRRFQIAKENMARVENGL